MGNILWMLLLSLFIKVTFTVSTCHSLHSFRKFASPLDRLSMGNIYVPTAILKAATITVDDLCHIHSGLMDYQ